MQEDCDKSREQLIAELRELRERQTSDKQGNESETGSPQPRASRDQLQTEIQFIGDFGLVKARGIDLSDGGICFEVDEDIPFDMEFKLDGEIHRYRARLVWMRRQVEGSSRFGFEFLEAPPSDLLWLYRELKDEPGNILPGDTED